MLTVSARLTPEQARRVGRAADALEISHEELTRQAVLLFVKALPPPVGKVKKRRSRSTR